MKKALIALCMLFVALTVQAQEVVSQETEAEKQKKAMELMSIKIDMTIDPNLFMEVTPNTFVSESPKAVIMAMIVPETYQNAKDKLESNLPPEFKVSDKGEKTMNGVNVVYLEGSSKAQGVTINSTVYCLKRDAETCIMFMGMLEDGADKKYADAIKVAANSVVKK
ncbi:hypothetical protein [Kordia jejudonensis]|uniref:hypothetical protein n=1 Tax=Kordia jejudonensis TaxID=1348245 RepID=UPI001F4CA0CF|nr:hypothetical protein [Kordia jejudonensis]